MPLYFETSTVVTDCKSILITASLLVLTCRSAGVGRKGRAWAGEAGREQPPRYLRLDRHELGVGLLVDLPRVAAAVLALLGLEGGEVRLPLHLERLDLLLRLLVGVLQPRRLRCEFAKGVWVSARARRRCGLSASGGGAPSFAVLTTSDASASARSSWVMPSCAASTGIVAQGTQKVRGCDDAKHNEVSEREEACALPTRRRDLDVRT